MAKKSGVIAHPRGSAAGLLSDGDWLVILASLLHDSHPESRALLSRLMVRSKHGRQIRLLRLIRDRRPTLVDMARVLKVSRRTVFRYLNDLENRGLRISIGGDRAYRIDAMPKRMLRVL
jgi:hypothetical protein